MNGNKLDASAFEYKIKQEKCIRFFRYWAHFVLATAVLGFNSFDNIQLKPWFDFSDV